MSTRQGQTRLRTLLLATVALVVTLAVLEIGVRLWVRFITPTILVLDDELGWAARTGAHRTYRGGFDGIVATVDTNALGLRGPMPHEPADRRRLLVLGDSFTQGIEVSDEEIFSTVWSRLRPELEVLNAGVRAYGTVQELLQARRLERRLHPDAYVLMVYDNDLPDNVIPLEPGMGPRPWADAAGTIHALDWEVFRPVLPPVPAAAWFYRHSLAVNLFNRRFFSFRHHWESFIADYRAAVSDAQQWAVLEAIVAELARGRQLAVVGIPERAELEAGTHAFTTHLAAVAERLRVPYVDLSHVLRVEHYHPTDVHWNAAGHRVVGEYLAARIDAGSSAADTPASDRQMVAGGPGARALAHSTR